MSSKTKMTTGMVAIFVFGWTNGREEAKDERFRSGRRPSADALSLPDGPCR